MDPGSVIAQTHDSNTSRSHKIYTIQIWFLVFLVAVLSFLSAFFFKRYAHASEQAQRLQRINREIELGRRKPVQGNELTPEERSRIEREVRAEYEARDAAITAELNELYEVEARIREKYELPSRVSAALAKADDAEGGKGGAASVFDGELFRAAARAVRRPPHLIYGLSRPSADLIVQEIRLRGESLLDLLAAMDEVEKQNEIMSHTPSIWPCSHPQARLSSTFGYRRDPFVRAVRHHDGTDIAAPAGATVVATAKGRVVFAGWDSDYGNIVKIDHGNNLETWYAHLQKYTVHSGDSVDRGQKIGTVGSTGRSTGPHVHYEVRVNGKPVDSSAYLGN